MLLSELKSDTNFLAGCTSATYVNSDKVRNMNIEYHRIATLIWESDGGWHFDDANNTDSPRAYKTLSNASASYTVPTTALRIEQIEVKDTNSNWQKLQPITMQDLAISPEQFLTGGGIPLYYMLEGNEIRLFPAPATNYVTMSSGMAVRLSRAVTELGVSATTTTPGFATPYHRMLSLAAAIDFTQDPQQRNFLIAQKDRLEKGLTRFYSKRAIEMKTKFKPHSRVQWRQYS